MFEANNVVSEEEVAVVELSDGSDVLDDLGVQGELVQDILWAFVREEDVDSGVAVLLSKVIDHVLDAALPGLYEI